MALTDTQKQQWLEWAQVLEQTTARQGRGRLHTLSHDGVHAYCCLGILLDAYYVRQGKGEWVVRPLDEGEGDCPSSRCVKFFDQETGMTSAAMLPYGIDALWFEHSIDANGCALSLSAHLAEANDRGVSFRGIAAMIRHRVATGEWLYDDEAERRGRSLQS